MTSAITKRILWKEFRTQRGLWGALALCAICFQLLALGLSESREDAAQIGFGIGVMLILCYAAGCGAISFAAEREEGTQLRLQTLACPPILTITLKLAYAALTSLALVGLFLTSAWLLSGYSIFSLFQEESSPQTLLGIAWGVFLFSSILLWTMFFSLLTRTVLFAIGLGAVGAFVFVWIVGITISEILPRESNPVNIGVSEVFTLFGLASLFLLAVAGINCVLAGRWFRQFAGDAPKVKRFSLLRRFRIRASSGGGSFVLKIGTELSDVEQVVSPAESLTEPCPRAALSWLYLARGSRTWRSLRFLRWREAHESRWRFILFFSVCLFFTAAFATRIQHTIDLTTQQPDQFAFVSMSSPNTFLAFVLFVLATGCGVMSFRQEHAGEQFRVLRDRGIPAWQVWLSKHLVWATRTALGTFVLISFAGLLTRDFAVGTRWLLTFVYGFGSADSAGIPVVILIWRAAIVTALFYSAGQLASLLFRRSVIAFASGAMLMTFLNLASVASREFGIPLGWSLLPLVPGALLLTLLRCRCWMLDQNGPRSWVPSAIVTAAALLICVTQSSLHRMWEYPDVDPQTVYAEAYPLTLGEQTFESLEAEVAPFLARQQPTAVARYCAELYRKASDKLRLTDGSLESDFAREFSQPIAFADFTAEQLRWLDEEAAALETTLTAACREECSFWSGGSGGSLNRQLFPEFIQEQAALVIASALQLEADGKVEEALDRFQLALNVSRHLGSDGGAFTFSESRMIARSVYAQLRQWAGNPLVTPELAERAVSMIRAHQQSLGSLTVMNVVEHRVIRSWLASFDSYAAEAFSAKAILYLGFIHHLPGEKTREQRIINLLETRLAKEFFEHRQILAGGSRGGRVASGDEGAGLALPVDSETLAQVFRTTPQFRAVYPDLTTAPRDAAFDCEQAARATELAIRMLSTSREKGTPPNPADHPARCRVDVWTGQELAWFPDGVDFQNQVGGTIIPANRAFLSSGSAAQTSQNGGEIAVAKVFLLPKNTPASHRNEAAATEPPPTPERKR